MTSPLLDVRSVAASRSPGLPARDTRVRGVLVVSALGAFLASLDLSLVNLAFPALQRSFPHASRPALAWIITAYVIAFASLLVSSGRMADRMGGGGRLRRKSASSPPGRR